MTQARVAWAERLFPLANEPYKLSKIAGVEIDGKSTVGFNASHPDGRDIKFYFDAKTFLIAKIETEVISPQLGSEPVLSESFYSEHKSYGGIIMPSKLTLKYDKRFFVEGTTIDYKMAATLDPEHFVAPE